MPVGRPRIMAALSDKRTCNNPSHTVLSRQDLPCYFTVSVQLFRRHHIFMGCDLEYTVRRCIDNERSGFHVFISVISDNLRTGIRPVAEDLSACFLFKNRSDFFRKSFRIHRQRFFRYDSRNLPMSDGRIFSFRLLRHSSIGANRHSGLPVTVDLCAVDSK